MFKHSISFLPSLSYCFSFHDGTCDVLASVAGHRVKEELPKHPLSAPAEPPSEPGGCVLSNVTTHFLVCFV